MEKKAKSCPTSKAKSSSACIKKQIVRNHQVPLRETAVKTVNLDLNLPENSPNIPADVSSARSNPEHQSQSGKTICSTQNRIRKSKEKENSDKAQDDIKKVNIPFNEKKFRGLVDLSSLEAVLAESTAEGCSGNANKRRACLPNRDPEPLLSDYFTPKFDTEYVFKFPPATIDSTKEWNFDSRSIIDVLEHIESHEGCSNS